MTDAHLMDANCVHGIVWYECAKCCAPPVSRLDQVRHLLAQAQARAIMDGLPASSPQTNERMAQAICEWMAGLPVIYMSGPDAT